MNVNAGRKCICNALMATVEFGKDAGGDDADG